MKPIEARAMIAELRSTYPNANVDADTLRIYERELKQLTHELAREAVISAIGSCRFLPTIAEIQHFYAIAREQRRRDVEAERRRLEREAEDNFERPSLRDIPAVQEHLAKLRGSAENPVRLEPAAEGPCDDCQVEVRKFNRVSPDVPRFVHGEFLLCEDCAKSRLRVKFKLDAENAPNEPAPAASG